MVKLEENIGQLVLLALSSVKPDGSENLMAHFVKLCGVEQGGLWVESKEMTQRVQQALKDAEFPKIMLSAQYAHFLPYSRIAFVAVPLTPFDPKTLGLTDDSQGS